MAITVRYGTTSDVDALVSFVNALDVSDPTFVCWLNNPPNAIVFQWWLQSPRAIALALDDTGAIVGFDLFNTQTGESNLTGVSQANLPTVVPVIARQEQTWTGIAPFGPVTTVPLLNAYLATPGFTEDSTTGLLHWVGP